jgi:MoxR-like ATPase
MTMDAATSDKRALTAGIESIAADLAESRAAIGKRIFGQEQVIELALVTLLAGGHGLLVGVPGVAKTRLVTTIGAVLGLESKRVQFTPDLMPSDIIGSEVLEETDDGRRSFRFLKGPVFTQLLMADEINRASPRTQSALLQAMQERQVTVAGANHMLPWPFQVLATQNPIEQEGTYPLPEAQLDRFLLEIEVPYPAADAERRMLIATTGVEDEAPRQVMNTERLREAQTLVRRLPVGESVVDAILRLTRGARPESASSDAIRAQVAWGPGPRSGQAFMLAARARALLDGRFAPSVDDVAALAQPILGHRMALTFAARAEGTTVAEVIAGLVKELV